MITKEQALQVCTERYFKHRAEADQAHKDGDGAKQTGAAAMADQYAWQYMQIDHLSNTDAAVAAMRERRKRTR